MMSIRINLAFLSGDQPPFAFLSADQPPFAHVPPVVKFDTNLEANGTFGYIYTAQAANDAGLPPHWPKRLILKLFVGINEHEADLQKFLADNAVQEKLDHLMFLRSLDNEHVVKHYAIGRRIDDEPPFRVTSAMEIWGEHLVAWSGTHVTESYQFVQHRVRQILEGLVYLHDQGIIHTDLKPRNILEVPGERPILKICDLDSYVSEKQVKVWVNAKKELDYVKQHMTGELPYISPEWMAVYLEHQAIRIRELGTKSDIYSLGVIALELFMGGEMQFKKGGTFKELQNSGMLAFMLSGPPVIPDVSCAEFKDFLAKCLDLEPQSRADARALLNSTFLEKTF